MKKRKDTGSLILVLAVCGLVAAAPAGAQLALQDLQPEVTIDVPPLSAQGFKNVPPQLVLRFHAGDPDGSAGRPARYRYLVKEALSASGTPIRTPTEYARYGAEVLSVADPGWSAWQDYPAEGEPAGIALGAPPDGSFWFVSIQVLDGDGLSNDPFVYQRSTAHLRVLGGEFFRPEVRLSEVFIGSDLFSQATFEIASGQPLNFAWTAAAAAYGAEIVSYRHGWDLVSPDDPDDPGWAGPPGLDADDLYAAERSFAEGMHSFTLRVEDSYGLVRIVIVYLRVVPFVARDFQLPLLVLDQTVDNNVNNWQDQQGLPRNHEDYRNAWWQFLADAAGGVAGLDWDRDWRDHTESVGFSDLVLYQAVLCYAEFNDPGQRMFSELRPVNGQDRFVWLAPYQEQGGNFFLVGGRSMESFLEGLPNYMTPVVFDTSEETYVVNGQVFVTGFGSRELNDGSTVPRGPRMYPYATAGIAALDWTSPGTKFIYGRSTPARNDRTVDCVGLKGLVLDEAFREHHLVPPGAIPDTMWTDPVIDWQDATDAAADTLRLLSGTFRFRADEFVDANIGPRTTPIVPRECAGSGPADMCVEPMFRGVARFDWLRERRRAVGESDWPQSRYTGAELSDGCGPLALMSYEGMPNRSARTNGQVFGYMSYVNADTKPNGKADVYWGFDPYRFDQEGTRRAIRWVLQYFGLQVGQ